MQQKYYMRKWELACIILNLATYKTITGYSRIFADISGPAATLTAFFSGALVFLLLWGLLTLYTRTNRKTILELAEKKFGKWAKYLCFCVLFIYLIFSAAVTLRETGEFIKAVSFPTAPLSFVFLLIVIGAILCCALGFDALGRTHSVIIPVSIFAIIIITLFAIPKGQISNLFPYLGYGAENTFVKGLSSAGLYSDLIILFLLAPFADRETDFKKTALLSSAVGIILNILIVFACTITAPYTVSGTIIHPFHQLIKLFSAGRFFQRIDGYFMYLAAICSILTLAINIFFASYSAKETFNLPKMRPLAFPLGAIITFLALIYRSREGVYAVAKTWLWIWFAVIFFLIGIILILPRLKRRKSQ